MTTPTIFPNRYEFLIGVQASTDVGIRPLRISNQYVKPIRKDTEVSPLLRFSKVNKGHGKPIDGRYQNRPTHQIHCYITPCLAAYMIRILSFLLVLFLSISYSLAQSIFHIDSLPPTGITLNKGWKFHAGDNPDWAKADFDDSRWRTIDPTPEIATLSQVRQAELGWFRLRLLVSPAVLNQSLTMLIGQVGASEIYLNGRLIYRFGVVSTDYQLEKTHYLKNQPFSLKLDPQPEQVIAIRYSFNHKNLYITNIHRFPVLNLVIKSSNEAYADYTAQKDLRYSQNLLLIGLFLVLGVMYLVLYGSFRAEKGYFYIGVFMMEESAQYVCQALEPFTMNTSEGVILLFIAHLLRVSSGVFLLIGMYKLFGRPKGWFWWIIVGYAILIIPLFFSPYPQTGIFVNCYYPLAGIANLHASLYGLRSHRSGTWVLLITLILVFPFFAAYVWLSAIGQHELAHFFVFFSSFVLPIGYSVFLAGEFARTSRSLQIRLVEVRELSEKTIVQEQEKQQILATQNERLEKQVIERTTELNKSLTDLRATQVQLIQKEKMASLGELTAGIAHEIQNPLNFVNNFSEVSTELVDELEEELDKGDTDEAKALAGDLRQNLQKITHHGSRASSIVKGMLEHSRTSTGERKPTDLNALADEYLKLAYQGLRAKDKTFNCELVTDFDLTLGLIEIVPQEIGRVLLNLFNNAFYAVAERQKTASADYQPTVAISTARVKGNTEIRVRDNGTGIPETVKTKIFQPFFTTKPTGEGTGLGLSLSYEIVTKGHGGQLTVYTETGQFTEFVVRLPV